MNGDILAARRNKALGHHDAVAHAEIEAIRKGGASFEKGELRGARLSSTTLRHVHDGVELVEGRMHRLRRRTRGRSHDVISSRGT
jgi:hypothetical protein